MGKATELSASRSLLLCIVGEFRRSVHIHEIRQQCQSLLGGSSFQVKFLKQALFELEERGWLRSTARGFYEPSKKAIDYVKGFITAVNALGIDTHKRLGEIQTLKPNQTENTLKSTNESPAGEGGLIWIQPPPKTWPTKLRQYGPGRRSRR